MNPDLDNHLALSKFCIMYGDLPHCFMHINADKNLLLYNSKLYNVETFVAIIQLWCYLLVTSNRLIHFYVMCTWDHIGALIFTNFSRPHTAG